MYIQFLHENFDENDKRLSCFMDLKFRKWLDNHEFKHSVQAIQDDQIRSIAILTENAPKSLYLNYIATERDYRSN